MDLFDLHEGELFLDARRNEVYKLIKAADETGHALARCVLWSSGNGWIFASRDSDENWNAYADIKRVSVSVVVEAN